MAFALTASRRNWSVPGWAPAVLVLAATAVLGPYLGAPARPLFVLACGLAGWYAWRAGPAAHLQASLLLFAFAPLARRMVDVTAGFDLSGLMLVGPLLALLAPIPQLRHLLDGNRSLGRQTLPTLIVAGCIVYATAITLIQGDWANGAAGLLKWMAPLLYAAAVSVSADRDDLLQAATSAFMVILPVTGLVGIYQYIDPPEWDRYWMQLAPILSIGQPVPYGVRVFSTMNGPASFATFTVVGLLLVCFLRSKWHALVVAVPASFALFLSLYRTAWLMLAAGILFCLLFSRTRVPAAIILCGILAVGIAAATLTPFGDLISDRIATFSDGGEDDSVQERMEQYLTLWNIADGTLFGVGFSSVDVGSAGAMATDGMIIVCWFMMGMVVGMVCVFGLILASVNMVAAAWRDSRPEAIMIGAMGCGALIQLPLANMTSGEFGFLFWLFAVLAALPAARRTGHGAR